VAPFIAARHRLIGEGFNVRRYDKHVPACRRHHRCKQAPGWQLAQPQPGVMRWTTPAGRSYTTRPTIYEQ
jgi:hypothetical protein